MAVRNLREGTVLKSKYRIGQVLGFGGFGITYLARNLELSQTVVIKEYFPMDLAYRDAEKGEVSLTLPREKNDRKVYQKGKKDFLSEARRMSALSEVPSVVKVLDWFEENETAYLVMEHVRGMGLDRYLERLDEPLSFQEAWKLMLPVLDGLEKVHEKGIIHRDFNPSNLMMQENGTLKMIDFGAARGYLDTEKTMTVLVKRGYAPPEQYLRHGPQGPWTDLYAVCATLYEMVTGVRPQPSIERMQKDQLYLPSAYGAEITPEEEKVLCRGLELTPIHRFRSVKELKEAFLEEEPKGEKKEKKKMMIIIAAAVIVCIAAAGGIWQYRIAKEEAVLKSYAGNYGKETEKYQEFLTFVKDNAVAEEETEPNEFFPEQGTSMVYTLPTEAVEEWGEPCNQFRLHETRDGLLEWLEKNGQELELQNEKDTNTVTVEKYGAVLTKFVRESRYQNPNGQVLILQSDVVDQELFSVMATGDGENEEETEALARSVASYLTRKEEEPELFEEWTRGNSCYNIGKGETEDGLKGYEFYPHDAGGYTKGPYYWPLRVGE